MGSIAVRTSPLWKCSHLLRSLQKGLIYAATPASDIVCGPCQLASGIGLQVTMTGRGTPYGLAIAPVIKVCSRNEMKEQWQDLIDINAGPVATGEADIPEIGTQLFMEIIDVASGRRKALRNSTGFIMIYVSSTQRQSPDGKEHLESVMDSSAPLLIQ